MTNKPLYYVKGTWRQRLDGPPVLGPFRFVREMEGSLKRCPYCNSSMKYKGGNKWKGLKSFLDMFFTYPRAEQCINDQCPNHYEDARDKGYIID